VLAHQLVTVDRSHLDGQLGTLPAGLMNQVNDALRLALNI
jgi:mRNA-degrading endonuclease toxin of MazEF toxin-antitoxin module